ncbi:DUF2867 domain-containing protein [Taibaiella chishuiensis]|uniref:Uncharacterized protein DUF2867 n=1 Tax=Taibaiella chishuiensis TaxID=1434707 RepID=A0A2P8D9T5_9BACT|nr:DUF2867 domain-containing protein [Taibaiella chishuiensis]PSK93931.1 uncharacterized protein DUF2867 [Taibaiella chishuiensis]
MPTMPPTATRPPDYSDSYRGAFRPAAYPVTPAALGRAFFNAGPAWIGWLFTLRNRIVALFGLKTPGSSKRAEQLKAFRGLPGERIGLFRVYEAADNRLVIGETDKHLDFRVILQVNTTQPDLDIKTLIITTEVHFHNRMGRWYFVPVKPLHRIIVPVMLKGMLRKPELLTAIV